MPGKRRGGKKPKKYKNSRPQEKEKEEGVTIEGIVIQAVKGSFRVQMLEEGSNIDPDNPMPLINAHIAGRLRKNYIKIVQGDRVRVEMSPYDLDKGRITYRLK